MQIITILLWVSQGTCLVLGESRDIWDPLDMFWHPWLYLRGGGCGNSN